MLVYHDGMHDETLILIPSPLVIPHSYKFLKEELQRKINLIIPELPSTSTFFNKKVVWTERDYSLWLSKILSENHVEKCFLLGHSNSGAIVIWLAKLHPEKIKGVIIVDSIGVKETSYVKILVGRIIDAFIEWRLTLWGFTHLIWNLIFHMPNFIFQIKESAKTNLLDVASKIRTPTLILWGKRDHTIPLENGIKLHSVIPGSEIYISEKGSHDWIITNAEEAAEVLEKWALETSSRVQAPVSISL